MWGVGTHQQLLPPKEPSTHCWCTKSEPEIYQPPPSARDSLKDILDPHENLDHQHNPPEEADLCRNISQRHFPVMLMMNNKHVNSNMEEIKQNCDESLSIKTPSVQLDPSWTWVLSQLPSGILTFSSSPLLKHFKLDTRRLWFERSTE